MEQQRYHDLKMGEKGAILSIIAYICLSVIKLWIGYLSNSEALKADGLNNATDIVASVAVLIGLRLSQKPADHDHPYGHWKAETVASLIASFIMMAVASRFCSEPYLPYSKKIRRRLILYPLGPALAVPS